MNFPVAVFASDGLKYLSPSAGAMSSLIAGSDAWKATIAATKQQIAMATRRPTCHLIRGPTKRCSQYSQITASGASKMQPIDDAADRRVDDMQRTDSHQQDAADQNHQRHGEQARNRF